MPRNIAAWLESKQAPLVVKPAPYTHPRDLEIVVKNHALAINPIDWILQTTGNSVFRWIKFPFVLGVDVAGEVVEVGSGVSRFKVGDRVIGHAVGTDKDSNNSAEDGFQLYTVLLATMTTIIPPTLSYENGVVLPLGVSTAACGLFQKDQLALEYPALKPHPNGETVLIWGGSSSVGSNAIQLAVAAGYEVITTCSPTNFDYVKELGALLAFDYNSSNVVKDITAAFEGKTLAGALAVGTGSAAICADIVHGCKGNKFVSTVSQPVSMEGGMSPKVMLKFVTATTAFHVKRRTRGIATNSVFASSIKANEVSKIIYEDFLPKALEAGRYIVAPKPHIVGQGLESIQRGIDIQKNGVSAKKVVIVL